MVQLPIFVALIGLEITLPAVLSDVLWACIEIVNSAYASRTLNLHRETRAFNELCNHSFLFVPPPGGMLLRHPFNICVLNL